MNRNPVAARFSQSIHTSFSYACMYYPPSYVPKGERPYPLPQPFLDIGDCMLCQNVYDGVAVGTLFNQKEDHALSIARDSMLKNSTLSRIPRTRKFAADLRVPQMEVVEFAWMEDDSLIIACRRLQETLEDSARPLVLSADILFYEVIPPYKAPDMPLLRMTIREKPAICQFCGVRGIQSCMCPPSFKRRAPSSGTALERREARRASPDPYAYSATAPGNWDGYAQRLFTCTQTGSFFSHWYRRSESGKKMKLFMSPPHPVSYQFVCGEKTDTIRLAGLYVKKMKLCQRAIAADARLYGGLTRGSNIGMLMDKKDVDVEYAKPQITADAYVEEETTLPLTASTAKSFETDPIDDRVIIRADIDGLGALSDDVSYPSTMATDSPSSSLRDAAPQQEDIIGESLHKSIAEQSGVEQKDISTPSEQSRHVMNTAYDIWGESDSGPPQAHLSVPSQRLTLSTTSRELQQYMTVDSSNTPMCKLCDKSFPKRGNLARHVQTVHLKLKPFQCDQCLTRFGHKNHLKRHQVVHQRGNEFCCSICKKDFKTQALLSRHAQQAHKEDIMPTKEQDDSNNHLCDMCGGTRMSCVCNLGAPIVTTRS